MNFGTVKASGCNTLVYFFAVEVLRKSRCDETYFALGEAVFTFFLCYLKFIGVKMKFFFPFSLTGELFLRECAPPRLQWLYFVAETSTILLFDAFVADEGMLR